MKYKIYQSVVKQKDREEFNRKLLKLIDNKETEKYGTFLHCCFPQTACPCIHANKNVKALTN